ncbi:substrate-binding domain-containing protein [uncultured Cohaesibacter sp.]|uniref:substrate-binding domain-containing protein n=1 Tax=uncultured Cohaesibacter sp. TaxID=1002546 RepID=UPI00292F64C9|nr:substrate-binding domain-containing protein [uncultured Cohaesibacter sp.]
MSRFQKLTGFIAAVGLASALGAGAAMAADPDVMLDELKTKVYSLGPNGETPSPASDIQLSDEELAKIKDMKATAAIVLHYAGNDWSQAQVNGLKAQFAEMGIEVLAVTDAGFKPEKQVADIETILAKKPDIIVSIPTDPVATAGIYKKAADQGVKLVFMDNVPNGLKAGEDYISVVSADNYGNGVASALLMAKALNGKGNVGAIYYAADFFVTQQRYDGFKDTIEKYFPDIKIIAEQGINGSNLAGSAERMASAMLTANRKSINGLWAVWDVPAEGVIAAARSTGVKDIVLTTCDLGANVAINMAQKSYVHGLGSQRPYDQGVTEAKLAGYGLLGKKAPDYVALPSLAVTYENLPQAWQEVYHQDLPKDVKDSMR